MCVHNVLCAVCTVCAQGVCVCTTRVVCTHCAVWPTLAVPSAAQLGSRIAAAVNHSRTRRVPLAYHSYPQVRGETDTRHQPRSHYDGLARKEEGG